MPLFYLSVRLGAFAPEHWTKGASGLQSGKEGGIRHFVEPQAPCKARPNYQNPIDRAFKWNWEQPPKSEPQTGTEVPDAGRAQGQFGTYRICHPTIVSPK